MGSVLCYAQVFTFQTINCQGFEVKKAFNPIAFAFDD